MRFLSIVGTELRREYLVWRSYRVNAVSTVIMWGIIFPILILSVQQVAIAHDVEFGPAQIGASMIGFLVWRLCMTVFSAIPNTVEEEARIGTLENIVLSTRASMNTVLTSRIIVRSARSVVETVLLALVIILFFKISLPITPLAILIIILTLAGACGVGLALAGAALVYKSVGSFVGLVTLLALFISGAAIPLNSLGTVFVVLKYVFPTTWGIDLLREVILHQHNLSELLASGELIGLAIQTMLMIAVGYYVFHRSFLKARLRGQLGTY